MRPSFVTAIPRNEAFPHCTYSSILIIFGLLVYHIEGGKSTPTWTTSRQHKLLPDHSKFATWNRQTSDSNDGSVTTMATGIEPLKYDYNIINLRRGGSTNEATSTTNDEERYSRQVYTLGAKAQGLVRTATVYIDGPSQSGLVYECAKNLALSGVRHIYFVTNDEDDVVGHVYHNPELDDLGRTYQRGAKAEIFGDSNVNVPGTTLLVEYTRRLNPSIVVSEVRRSALLESVGNVSNDCNTVLLCIDRPPSTAESLNHIARRHQCSFVATETAGVFGKVFCDFGAKFVVDDPDGETPLISPLDHISADVDGGNIVVHCIDGERHDVSKGDLIQFQYRNGETSKELCTVIDVQTPFRFIVNFVANTIHTVEDYVAKINEDASSFSRIKSPIELAFDTLKSATKLALGKEEMFTPCDLDKSYDIPRRWASISCFHAVSAFIEEMGRLPVYADKELFVSIVKKSWPSNDFDERAVKYIDVFLRTGAAKFSPLQSVFGAISSQEVLKAITRLYYPIHQFLLYDCDEVLNFEHGKSTSFSSTLDSPNPEIDTPGLRYILGDVTVNKLQSAKIFVVGSGAIGCEILKNLAALGVGTINDGKVVITDMDTIEKSNLSRQLLFRDGDIGKFKSTAAREAILRLGPFMRIEVHACKVGDGEDNNPFDESFWSGGVDVVLNALDNVEARLFIDKKCVTNKKALIDAGTMGPKGNVQVVVPHQSESYASSADPPEPSIPLCTVKNFPYSIAHTIQWGRDLFEGLFQRRPQQANDFLDNLDNKDMDQIAAKFTQEQGADSAANSIRELQEDLSMDTSCEDVDLQIVRKKLLLWAITLAFKLYFIEPKELLKKHPLASLDDEGLPFWSGSRRPPRSLTFNASCTENDQYAVNENFIEFVRYSAMLRSKSLASKSFEGIDSDITAAEAKEACTAFFSRVSDTSIRIHTENKDILRDGKSDTQSTLYDKESLQAIVPSEHRMMAIEFEKDNEFNGHVAFVNAASNLRAMVYGIPTVDALETRRVAGKIIPAMITTTAFVSALSCCEFLKVVQQVGLKRYRNAFINLALPFFAFTMPLPAEQMQGLDGNHYTLWDQLSISESEKASLSGGITLKSLLKQIRKLASKDPTRVNVISVSAGPYLLYANFLHEEDDEVLLSSLWKQVTDAVNSSDAFVEKNSRDANDYATDLDTDDSHIDLTVVVEDIETGDEVELPPFRVHRFQQ